MKLTPKRLILFLILLVLFGITLQSARGHLFFTQQPTEAGTLGAYVQEAQSLGLSTYEFPAGFHEYWTPQTWPEVINNFTFVVADVTEAKSHGVANDRTISTWYRFQIVETLSSKPAPFAITNPPNDMTAPQANEILMFKWSGTVTLNGVQLIAEEPSFPPLTVGQRCLLIVQLDSNTRLANNALGSNGVYLITNDTFTSINPEGSYFASDLANLYNNSLTNLRAALSNQ